MSLMSRIARGMTESRAQTLANPTDWLVEAFTGGSSYAGKAVTGDTAMTLVPVFSASSLVASAVGGVPLKVYDADREEARSTRQWKILHDQPNDEMAADELWELITHHLLLWGNAFLIKDRDEFGVVRALWPLRPSRMQVGREPQGNRAVRYFTVDGQPYPRYYETDILHIRGLGSDGLIGYSVVQLARQQMGNMLAQDEFSGRFWANGTFLGAALMHPGEMSEEAQLRLRKQMNRKQGVAEANGLWVFEEDMKYQSLGMPLRDAMWLEQAKMSDGRVAQMFGLVPPHRWGYDSGNMTYANTEVAGTEFVRWTGRKWWKRIEKSLHRDQGLFPGRSELYPEFVTADLMRGDTKTRYETYEIAIRSKVLTRNEARAAENLPPLDGGDEFEEPVVPVVPAESPSDDEAPPPARAGGSAVEVRLDPEMLTGTVASHVGDLAVAMAKRRNELDVHEQEDEMRHEQRMRQHDEHLRAREELELSLLRSREELERAQVEALANPPVVNVTVEPTPIDVTVNVPKQDPPVVNVDMSEPRKTVKFRRDVTGRIDGATIDEA